jgi:curved DNA-binding protein CbpA
MKARAKPPPCACATAPGATRRASCPAPKSPNSPERWYFCTAHAAEYNQGWNYFEGLDKEEAELREKAERGEASGYAQSAYQSWAGPGDGSRSRDEMRGARSARAGSGRGLRSGAQGVAQQGQEVHPDVRPGDADAAAEFLKLQTAYEVLRAAEERREWKGSDAN